MQRATTRLLAAAGYPFAEEANPFQPISLRQAATNWLRECQAADLMNEAVNRAYQRVGLASDRLNKFRDSLKGRPLFIEIDEVLYAINFRSQGEIQWEIAAVPEEVEREVGV